MSKIRLAHILLVHKNPEQVNAFVRQITADRHADVYIHIDAKCPEAMVRTINVSEHVQVSRERVAVTWGDYNTIDATMVLLRAVRNSGKEYDFVSLNSGQDLLVRDGLAEHLAKNKGKLFLVAERYEANDPRNFYWRVRWPKSARNIYDSPFHPYRLMRAGLRKLYQLGLNLRPNRHPLPDGWLVHRGSQWFCIPGAAVDFILDYVAAHPSIEDVFRDSLVPDMTFFQTLLMYSPFAPNVTGANLTYLNFGKNYVDNNHPVVLTKGDIPAIENSGRFFARKFDPVIDPEVVDYFCSKYGHVASAL